MVVLTILRWINGGVSFQGEGKHPEHFINAAVRAQARMWNVKCKGSSLTAHVASADYKSLRPLAKKAGMRIRMKKKSGLPFYMRKLRRRPGLIVGAVLFFAVLQCLSLFVWDVQVEGNDRLTREQVMAVAQELGLKPGAMKKEINIQLVEQGSLSRMPELSWLAANISGGKAEIRVRERDLAPEMVPEKEACNIKARCAGQVLRMEAYAGSAMVKEGEAVVEGQLLISGIVEDSHGGSMIKHASGKVYASVRRKLTAEVPLEEVISQPVGEPIYRGRLGLFGLDFPISVAQVPGEDYACTRQAKQLVLFGSTLPVFWYEESWVQQLVQVNTLSREQAEQKARAELNRQLEELSAQDITLLEKTETVEFTETSCRITFDAACKENIAVEQKLEIQFD